MDAEQALQGQLTGYHPFIQETLEQYAHYPAEWRDTLTWLYDLPLFIERHHFRAVHACWDQALIDPFQQDYHDATLDKSFLMQANVTDSFANRLINRLTRGISLSLPDGISISGADGVNRRRFRVKFWKKNPQTYSDIAFQSDRLPPALANRALTDQEKAVLTYYGAKRRLLFIGHYWLKGMPQPQTTNIACLDYSGVVGGRLVAYRLGNESVLSKDKFLWVNGC